MTKKTWKDRGKGRGFGWLNVKSRKFVCVARSSGLVARDIDPEKSRGQPVSISDKKLSLKGKSD